MNAVDMTASASTPGARVSMGRPGPRSTMPLESLPTTRMSRGMTRASTSCSAFRTRRRVSMIA
ncbi:MAG: hypothetical protein WKF83_04575 [Nocardioidaceae bacterium]